ncbi:hypothetical protein BDV25DRAFT_46997 [Aspergillus avenaceus]|uniref:FAD-binding PCMH-type domain-containing protein n=1 Tax=Aspergillus avenaceus TaxID=36643 RepID=A0A5N6TK55_ASPAV|nr:hypothetical protein BDV25DRAFT_46997 [Aspergillus avenaceus]
MADSQLAALEFFLQDHPEITYVPPFSPYYPAARKVWNVGRPDRPLAFLYPQSAEDVSAIVRYAKSAGIKFTIRAGGHNLEGRSIVENALTVDLRALRSVHVAADHQSATVGGGILASELGNELWKEGVATPLGAIPSVGYVGWATYGGYGSFSSNWGLGADQILGATLVNADGDIVKADEGLLKGLRGGGGVFGVIVDITIKVYPLKSLLAGAIMFNSQDVTNTFIDFNAEYEKLQDEGIPLELTVQQICFNAPPGRVYGVIFVWSGDDLEEGKRWNERISSLGPVVMNTVAVTTVPEYYAGNAGLVPNSAYGSTRTLNIRRTTPEVARAIGSSLAKMPSDPVTMLSVHQLRGPSAAPKENSVFGTREPHFMLEIIGCATAQEVREFSEEWAAHVVNAVQQTDSANILSTVYASLYPLGKGCQSSTLNKIFGSHTQEILALKDRYDPENVFSLTVPELK